MLVKSKSGRVFDLPDAQEEAQIRAGIAADPDTREFTAAEIARMRRLGRGRPKALVTKEAVSIRLSPEVLAYFRGTGKGWQTRIDAVLREYVEGRA